MWHSQNWECSLWTFIVALTSSRTLGETVSELNGSILPNCNHERSITMPSQDYHTTTYNSTTLSFHTISCDHGIGPHAHNHAEKNVESARVCTPHRFDNGHMNTSAFRERNYLDLFRLPPAERLDRVLVFPSIPTRVRQGDAAQHEQPKQADHEERWYMYRHVFHKKTDGQPATHKALMP
jgi:hypothetical protein